MMASKLYTIQINDPNSGGIFNGIMEVNDVTKNIESIYEISDADVRNLLVPISETVRTSIAPNKYLPTSVVGYNPTDLMVYPSYNVIDSNGRTVNNVYDPKYSSLSRYGIVVNSLGSVIDNYVYSLDKLGVPIISTGNARYYITYNRLTVYDKTKTTLNSITLLTNVYSNIFILPYTVSCFTNDCLISTIDGDVEIQDIVPGTFVETLTSGIKKVTYVGKKNVCLSILGDDPAFKIFSYPSGLKVTGKHSVLVDELTEEQKEEIPSIIGSLKQTEGKWLLPVCLDEEATDVCQFGLTDVYHLVLENDDDDANYGILSHGKWVETCSKNNFDKYVRL